MNDVEIQSLLEDAGYRYDTVTGEYLPLLASEDFGAYNAQDIADELEIPLEDLMRWQEEQAHEDETRN